MTEGPVAQSTATPVAGEVPAGPGGFPAADSTMSSQAAEEWKVEKRSRRLRRLWIIATRIGIVAALLAAWEFMSGPVINPLFVSSPLLIADRIVLWTSDGTILHHSVGTFQAMIVGYIFGSSFGVGVGYALGRVRVLDSIFEPFIVTLYSMPKIALAPLFLLWFGIGLTSKVMLTALIVFFLVFYNTYAGARSVDAELVDVVRVMGGSRWSVTRNVVIPSAAAHIFTGLRMAVPQALVGAVVAEIIASNRGLGYLLSRSTGFFDSAGTFAALFVLAFVAVIVNGGVARLDKRASRWR